MIADKGLSTAEAFGRLVQFTAVWTGVTPYVVEKGKPLASPA
jgi:hypothetical protein